MPNRKIMILAILLVSLLAISAVSAAENVRDDIAGAENNAIAEDLTSNMDEIVSYAKTFTDLNSTLNDNTQADVYLDCDYTYNPDEDSGFKEGIALSRDVTIHGKGFAISGNNTASIFKVTDGNVVFRDIVFLNGNGYRGGAINGKCTAINCTFTGNTAENGGEGGAVYGKCTAINCTFRDNHADQGGAMSRGSAVGCTFTGNTANNYGGGALSSCYAENCIFTGNYARYGGAMSGGNAVSCTFISNSAWDFGGAVSGKGTSSVNCTFINNTAGDYGGAVSYGSAENSTFINNFANNYGGGMYDASVVGCRFINNTAIKFGGGAIFSGYAVNSAFINNDISGVETVNCTFIPAETLISAQNMTTVYGVSKELIITLKDIAGNALSAAKITVSLNGKSYECYTDSDGEASIAIPDNLNPDTYTATVTYAGNSECLPSETAADIKVTKADTFISASENGSKLVARLTHGVTGKAISTAKIIANINGADYDSKTDSEGKARFSITELPQGTYTVTVSYKGNNKYAPSSASVNITAKTNIIISAVYDDENNEITATLTNEATGKAVSNTNVKFELNGETTTVKTNSKGQAKLSTAGLPLGTYTATISYAGNSKYNPASTTINIAVKTKVIVTDVYAYSDRIVAKLTNGATGKYIANANMIIEINGVKYNAKSDNKGQLTFNTSDLDLPSAYDLTISYRGNSRYTASSATVAVDLNKANMNIKYAYDAGSKQLTATLKNSKTGKTVSSANMVVDLDGVKTTYKSNKQGQIIFSTEDFAPGTHVGTITYGGNARYNSISAAFKVDV